jgi:hypothetical protein
LRRNAPLSLWNSGHLNGGSSFSKTINFAGSYPYHRAFHSSMRDTIKVRLQVTPPSGSPDTTFAIAVASVAPPSGSVRRHPAEEGKRRLDGVENRDHVEVRKVQAEGVGNVVVPVASAQDVERREERLVAGAVDIGDVTGRDQNRSNRIDRLTSWMAFVTSMPRGQASVQLKVVRHRNTPVRSARIPSRSSAPWSRES